MKKVLFLTLFSFLSLVGIARAQTTSKALTEQNELPDTYDSLKAKSKPIAP